MNYINYFQNILKEKEDGWEILDDKRVELKKIKSLLNKLKYSKDTKRGQKYTSKSEEIKNLQERYDIIQQKIDDLRDQYRSDYGNDWMTKISKEKLQEFNRLQSQATAMLEKLKTARSQLNSLKNKIIGDESSRKFREALDAIDREIRGIDRKFNRLHLRSPSILANLEDLDPNLISVSSLKDAAARVQKQIDWVKGVVADLQEQSGDGSIDLGPAIWLFGEKIIAQILGDIGKKANKIISTSPLSIPTLHIASGGHSGTSPLITIEMLFVILNHPSNYYQVRVLNGKVLSIVLQLIQDCVKFQVP